MKKAILLPILAFALPLLSPQIAQAQGTIYVSSLGLPSTGSASVGSDLWLAEGFWTGTNAAGYVLNSVQLALGDAVGNPSGFTAMIYNQDPQIVIGPFPGSSISALNGSLDPVGGGIYTYTPGSSLTLSPRSNYFIVLTARTTAADGAYQWSFAAPQHPTSSGGWGGSQIPFASSDGLNWGPGPVGTVQFAISATAVPEPATLGLLALGGLFLVRYRRKAQPVGTA
jgi:hypothetical protein